MEFLKKRKQSGLTLVELMLSLAAGLVVLGAIISVFIVEQKVFSAQEQQMEALQTVRATMAMITHEAMMAGFCPNISGGLQRRDDTLPTFSGVVYDASALELEIRADIDGSGAIVTEAEGPNPNDWKYDANERIVYKKIGSQLKRKTGRGSFQPFAENIKAFTFSYLKADGAIATRASDIRNVRIFIEVETQKTTPGVGNYGQSLSSLVNLRNMGME